MYFLAGVMLEGHLELEWVGAWEWRQAFVMAMSRLVRAVDQ